MHKIRNMLIVDVVYFFHYLVKVALLKHARVLIEIKAYEIVQEYLCVSYIIREICNDGKKS